MKATRVRLEDLQHNTTLLVGHRLSSDRRTVSDWALGMFDTTRYYFNVVPSQSITLRTELIGRKASRPYLPPIVCWLKSR